MSTSTIHIITTLDDNRPNSMGEGWTNVFKSFLEIVLRQMGEVQNFNIKIHTEELDEGFKQNDAVVTIVSPHFVNSISKVQFIENLIEAKSLGDSDIQVFKVMKTPISQHDMPKKLRQLLAYNFYYVDMESGIIKEYEQFENVETDNAFWMTMVDLVYDILNHFQGEGQTKATMGKGKYIYLAEVGSDLVAARQLVKRELKRFGYQVLPNQNMPDNEDELEIMIRADLNKCSFSIHMIGEERGAKLSGQDSTYPEIQERIADEHSTKAISQSQFFNQLVWLAPGMKISNEKHKIFVEELKKNANKEFGSELIQMRLEDFKSVILRQLAQEIKRLVNLDKQNESQLGHEDARARVYLITDKRDFEGSKKIADWLVSHGYDILWPDNGKVSTDRETHVRYLNECDATIIYYQDASKEWLITKLQDILKSPGLGRNKPKGPNAIYAISDDIKNEIENLKEQYEQYEDFQIIAQNGIGFPDELLEGFLQNIEQV